MATGPDLHMSTSFRAFVTADHDAFLLAKGREVDLIIMGKAPLGAWNDFKDQTISPGWSALAGEIEFLYDGKADISRTDQSMAVRL